MLYKCSFGDEKSLKVKIPYRPQPFEPFDLLCGAITTLSIPSPTLNTAILFQPMAWDGVGIIYVADQWQMGECSEKWFETIIIFA